MGAGSNGTTITAKFVADTSGFNTEKIVEETKAAQTSTAEMTKGLAEVEGAGKQATAGIHGIGEASANASGETGKIGSSISAASSEIERFRGGFIKISEAAKISAKDIERMSPALREVYESMNVVDSGSGKVMGTVGELGDTIDKTRTKAKDLGSEGGTSLQEMATSAAEVIQPWMQILQIVQMTGQAIAAVGAQAAQVKSTQGAFDSLTGSTQKSDEMLNQLNKSAAADDFGAKAVDAAAQKMLMMGADSKTVVPEVQKVADGLAAMGGNAQQLTPVIDQLDKMRSEARITTSDMDNLVSNGLPAWEALAQGMGTTVTQAQKQVADGDMQGAQAYQKILSGLEQYGGAAEAQSKDLGAEYDRLTESSKGAFGGLSDWFAKDLEGINEMIKGTWELNQNIEDLLGNIGKVLSSGFTGGGMGGSITGTGIPGHAAGGTNLSGLSVVGENGPELFDPAGGSIYPLDGGGSSALSSLPALGGTSGPLTVQVHLDSAMIARQTFPHMAPMIRVMTGKRA